MGAADIAWIKYYMRREYEVMVSSIQGEELKLRPVPALLAYVAMAVGFCVQCLASRPEEPGVVAALYSGYKSAVFGAVAYVIYNATAAAIFHKWSLRVALADVSWGTLLFYLSYVVAYLLVPVQ